MPATREIIMARVRVLPRGLLACVGLALLAGGADRAGTAEDTAARQVEEQGGKVERDAKAPGKPVVAVDLSGTKAGDAGLKELAAFKHLRALNLAGTGVTERGLKELAPLKHLHELHLSQNQVTDQALQSLHQAGLLHALSLATTLDGAKRPEGPQQVTHLKLSVTRVTDAAVEHLGSLKNLRWLDLSLCDQVGDPGLKHLAALPTLKGLNLNATAVSDAGLKHLASVKTLEHVQLRKTRVTDAGVRELQNALPGCKIIRSPSA
jgi:internalin A